MTDAQLAEIDARLRAATSEYMRTQVEIVVQRLVDTGTLRDNQSFRDEAIDAIEKVAREFAEKAVRRYHLYRGTTYECTTEQLILSALRDAEK